VKKIPDKKSRASKHVVGGKSDPEPSVKQKDSRKPRARRTLKGRDLHRKISDAFLEYRLGTEGEWDWESGPEIPEKLRREPEFSNEIIRLVQRGCKKAVLFWCLDYGLATHHMSIPDKREFRSIINSCDKTAKQLRQCYQAMATVAVATATPPPVWNVWDSALEPRNEMDLPRYEDLPLAWQCDHALARLPHFLYWCSRVAKEWVAPNLQPIKNAALPLSVYLEMILSKRTVRERAGASHQKVAELLGLIDVPQPAEDTVKKNLYNFKRRSPKLFNTLRKRLREFHATAKE
jgi:hypothetical protein